MFEIIDCKGGIIEKKILDILYAKGICVLKNYFSENDIQKFNQEFERIFHERKKDIQILNKEDCSNDERVFYAEKYSKFIRDKFSNNKLFDTICKKYTKAPFNKKTLINKLRYEEGKVKNSGAGWHRDNHHCQFKTIIYLTDVTEENGNFQWITNSNLKNIGKPPPRTKNYDTRFFDSTVEELIKNEDKCNLVNIIGEKGTIIIADTTYIHRGNIIKRGERRAITQYYF